MNRDLLKKLNQRVRKSRPNLPTDNVCQIFQENDLLEIGFLSNCCRNDLNGSCIMCDYGCAMGMQEQGKYLSEMKNILDNINSPIKCLLLCTNGSFFDESQIPLSLFKAIITLAKEYDIPTIEFETHYLDISSKKLDIIQEILPSKHIMIEMGLETVNPLYQENVIMKNINLQVYEQTIRLIQQYGFDVETNIMVGLPFLSPKEQIEDARNTIMWSFSHQCKVVLFPINIKPYTVLRLMYRKGIYTPISHWLLILLLDSLPTKDLAKITIAWYGNREEKYSDIDPATIFPIACHQCQSSLLQFYSKFLVEADCKKRKNIITQLIASCKCQCLNNQVRLLNQIDTASFETRYEEYCNIIKKEYFKEENFNA